MCTHNPCFRAKKEKYHFSSENCHFYNHEILLYIAWACLRNVSLDDLANKFVLFAITLRLHYVPGDHGSHGSPKRSAPCDLVIFCLGTHVLLSIITFRHGLSRYPLQTVG